MGSARIEFDGARGVRLAARLDRPEGPVRASAIFAHCFSCSKDLRAARLIAGRLAAAGIAVLRFDFTGLGHSQGEFGNGGFAGDVADLLAAARFLADEGMAPQLLVGHSLGGAAVLAAAGRIASVAAVATIGAPADPAHVLESLGGAVARIRAEGEAEVTLAGRSFRLTRAFLEETEAQGLAAQVGALRRALLVLHAPRDMQVGIDHASAIFRAAKHPKSFISLENADHLLSRAEDAAYAAEVIAAWAGRYLPAAPEAAAEAVPEGVTRVSEADPEGFAQEIRTGSGHQLRADEPAGHGGTGLGPSPYQLLAAGLGACTTMTIRMYARRKGWPLAHVAVDVTHDKVHAEDCADCEGQGGRIDLFRRAIRLEGELDAGQRARLMEIADRCPVHRTLEAQARIETVEA